MFGLWSTVKSFVRYGRRSLIRKIFNFRPRHGIMIIKKVLLPTCLLQLKQSWCLKYYIAIKMTDHVLRWGQRYLIGKAMYEMMAICFANPTPKPTLLFGTIVVWILVFRLLAKAVAFSVLVFSPLPHPHDVICFLLNGV